MRGENFRINAASAKPSWEMGGIQRRHAAAYLMIFLRSSREGRPAFWRPLLKRRQRLERCNANKFNDDAGLSAAWI
jgi:hypothetical protein